MSLGSLKLDITGHRQWPRVQAAQLWTRPYSDPRAVPFCRVIRVASHSSVPQNVAWKGFGRS